MPANKKYLLKSGWARASKVIAAILGGLVVSCALHVLFGLLLDAEIMILSIWFTFPITWAFVITLVYWIKSPWKVWGMIASISLMASVTIYLIKT